MTDRDAEQIVDEIEKDDRRKSGLSKYLVRAAVATSLISAITTVVIVVAGSFIIRSKNDRVADLTHQLGDATALTQCRSNLSVAYDSAKGKADEAEQEYLESIGNLTVHLASLPPGDPNRAAAFQSDFGEISFAVNNLHELRQKAVDARVAREATNTICKESP